MRRRAFLTSLAFGTAGLSGCTGLLGGGEETDTVTPYEVPTDERTTVSPSTPGGPSGVVDPRQWQTKAEPPVLTRLETTPRTLAFAPVGYDTPDGMAFGLRVTATATPDHPVFVQTLLYNTNEYEKTVDRGRFPLLGRTIPTGEYVPPIDDMGDAGPPGDLLFVPTPDHPLHDQTFESIRRGPDGAWHADIFPGDHPQGGTVTVGPRSGIVGEYAVCAGRGDGPLKPGTYILGGPTVSNSASPKQALFATVWNSDSPGPNVGSVFDSSRNPTLGGDPEVQWFHRADERDTRYLLPDRERLELPTRVELYLVNRNEHWTAGAPRLYKREAGRWYDIGPKTTFGVRQHVAEPRTVDERGIATFELHLTHDDDAETGSELGLGYLGGGEYAAVVTVESLDERHGALLDIEAPDLTAWPERDVTVVRDGSTVTVTDPGVSGGEDAAASAVLERVDADPTRYLLDEQIMGQFGAAVRNTFSVVEDGVDTVRYHAGEQLQTISFGRIRDRTVGYDGGSFSISIENTDLIA